MTLQLSALLPGGTRSREQQSVTFDTNFYPREKALIIAIVQEHHQRIFEVPLPERVDVAAQRWHFSKEGNGTVSGRPETWRFPFSAGSFEEFITKLRSHCRTPVGWVANKELNIDAMTPAGRPSLLSGVFSRDGRNVAKGYLKTVDRRSV